MAAYFASDFIFIGDGALPVAMYLAHSGNESKIAVILNLLLFHGIQEIIMVPSMRIPNRLSEWNEICHRLRQFTVQQGIRYTYVIEAEEAIFNAPDPILDARGNYVITASAAKMLISAVLEKIREALNKQYAPEDRARKNLVKIPDAN
ncbi:hypothetical protein U1Q18_052239 [Sarracenia purpurea var. burkii]